MKQWLLLGVVFLSVLTACGTPTSADIRRGSATTAASASPVPTIIQATKLRLATTTSTADSGLLDAIVPDFEQRYNADAEVIAVGTGQALKLGENGDVDVVLVHARAREDAFVAAGFGINRCDVMYNDFIIVGPPADPAKISSVQSAQEAFAHIAAAEVPFASRGDDSGTHSKEQAIWASTGIMPSAERGWYKSLGQGMGETLLTANELGAYTLVDRGTYLSMRDQLPNLVILVGGETIKQNPDQTLRNPYGIIQVNPAQHAGINSELATAFVEWITSPDVQQHIGEFGKDQFGQPLFYPQAQR